MEKHPLRQLFEEPDGKPGPATASFALIEAALRILALVALLSTLVPDLLLHRRVGARHGGVIRGIFNIGGLVTLPSWWPGAWRAVHTPDDYGLSVSVLLAAWFASWAHWLLRLRPSQPPVHSRSMGEPHAVLYKLRLSHEAMITLVEPGVVLIAGMALFTRWQGFGTWVIAMGVGWAVRNTVLVFKDRGRRMDQEDAGVAAQHRGPAARHRAPGRPCVARVAG